MRKRIWVCGAALLFSVACKKKQQELPKGDDPVPKAIEHKQVEPGKPGDVPVTSRSPDAIKEFETGRDLVDNMRGGEAVEHFKKAVELDPDFAQAHGYLGIVTPG